MHCRRSRRTILTPALALLPARHITMMKICVAFALICVASAIAPPRIALDLAGKTPSNKKDFAETCPAGLTGVDQKLCPFPKASAWDHHDQQWSNCCDTGRWRLN